MIKRVGYLNVKKVSSNDIQKNYDGDFPDEENFCFIPDFCGNIVLTKLQTSKN
ncbi:MAG: hypothetical protein SCALA702_38320 [Melioribacteraceae bacterium]|nr:MAG: hypothetical protein SCALA702_38320 [Melioribacteraceae bacterium]